MGKRATRAQKERLQNVLRQLRYEADLTQTDLARILKRPQSFVSKYETGERRLDILELREVCHALGVTLVQFANRLEARPR